MMIDSTEWPQLEELDERITEELNDTRWAKGTHGTPYLYNRGCRGPMCKKVNRIRKAAPEAKQTLEDGYIAIREKEYLEKKRAKQVAEYMKTRPPGTTREDWIERAMQIGRQEQAS